MSENNSITVDRLKWFISEGKVQGWVSHVWFNLLRSRFPFHFLYYSQKNTSFLGFRKTTKELDSSLGADYSAKFTDLTKYIAAGDLSARQIKEFEKLTESGA